MKIRKLKGSNLINCSEVFILEVSLLYRAHLDVSVLIVPGEHSNESAPTPEASIEKVEHRYACSICLSDAISMRIVIVFVLAIFGGSRGMIMPKLLFPSSNYSCINLENHVVPTVSAASSRVVPDHTQQA